MTDPASVGWSARLVSKLPSFRGLINYFYVAANWSRISEEQEAYRRQIKDREEWAARALAQQDQLHELGMQRSDAELKAWRHLADQVSKQRDSIAALANRAIAALEQGGQIIEARNNALADCAILLAVLLHSESPESREVLIRRLDEGTQRAVEHAIERIARKFPPPGPPSPGPLRSPWTPPG